MQNRLLSALASAITITFGLLALLGLLLRTDTILNQDIVDGMTTGARILIQLTTITVAITVLIGVFNLLVVHVRRVITRPGQKSTVTPLGRINSIVLIASFALAVGTYILSRDDSLILLETVQLSVESALAGILFFALVYGAYRMMQHRVTWSGMLFVTVLLIVLTAAIPLSSTDFIEDFRDWLFEIPVSAGARGLLLGIALATVVTGVRVLIGVDRSYRE